MTANLDRWEQSIVAEPGVYAPQADSRTLLRALGEVSVPPGARVLDLCTGSGVIAIGAAMAGAHDVVAYDISGDAVRCAQRNADAMSVSVDVRLGGLPHALADGPFDLVLCNPPYVPADRTHSGALAWDAGDDGRLLLDPLCTRARELLCAGGTLLIVHSEFSGTDTSLAQLRAAGLKASVVARTTIDFGPVMHERAAWLEARGLLDKGVRREELVVIRGDRGETDVW